VEAFRRFDARRRSPSYKAIQLAGPPVRWLVGAGFAGLAVVVILALSGVRDSTVLIAVPPIAFTVACLLDGDGWRIRMATGELAALQRLRWSRGQLPADPLSAEAWLGAHPDAPALDRMAVMVTAGRTAEASRLADGVVGATPVDVVRLARMRLTVAAALAGVAPDRAAVEAFERLPELATIDEPERRYQRLSLAWSIAWLEINADRPWRAALAEALRDLGPFRPPRRFVAFHALQQFALPIAYVLAWLIVGWLGITDLLR
jgi:hypothetical protein